MFIDNNDLLNLNLCFYYLKNVISLNLPMIVFVKIL